MSNDTICPVCGKPTEIYMGHARKDKLCKQHGWLAHTGEISLNAQGLWVDTKSGKVLNPPPEKVPEKAPQKAQEPATAKSSELTCIICGEPSNGKHFCLKCYHQYKNQSVDIRITNCVETEILDEYGNLKYTCDDGRKVRSRAELAISNWLFNNKIRSVYEQEVYYKDENGETKTLHPDFYLPDQGCYIEYNELKNKPYLKSKEYTKKIYEQLKLRVIIMTEKDLENIAACLKPELGLH